MTLRSASDSTAANCQRRSLSTAFAALGCALAIAACGSSDPTSSSRLTGQTRFAGELAFAKCMRLHGMSNFPAPKKVSDWTNKILRFNSGINLQSPAFQSAQTSCRHLLPGCGQSFITGLVAAPPG